MSWVIPDATSLVFDVTLHSFPTWKFVSREKSRVRIGVVWFRHHQKSHVMSYTSKIIINSTLREKKRCGVMQRLTILSVGFFFGHVWIHHVTWLHILASGKITPSLPSIKRPVEIIQVISISSEVEMLVKMCYWEIYRKHKEKKGTSIGRVYKSRTIKSVFKRNVQRSKCKVR